MEIHPLDHLSRLNPAFLDLTHPNQIDLSKVISHLTTSQTITTDDRFYCWLLLLHVLTVHFSDWPTEFAVLLSSYQTWVESSGFSITENSLSERLHTDVLRASRILLFLPTDSHTVASPDESDPLFEYQGHLHRIERLLCVFTKVAVGRECIQGMNEIATVFYFVALGPYFDSKTRTFCQPDACDYAEALAYFCVQQVFATGNLIAFYSTMDRSRMIEHELQPFSLLLEKHFPKTANILKSAGVEPVYYALRWFTLLFSQEHDLPSLLMIWDNLFAHFTHFRQYLYYVGLAHLQIGEERLVPKDSSRSLHAVQHLKVSGRTGEIIGIAEKLWTIDHGPIKHHSSLGNTIRGIFTGAV
jgi:hypothetical protein